MCLMVIEMYNLYLKTSIIIISAIIFSILSNYIALLFTLSHKQIINILKKDKKYLTLFILTILIVAVGLIINAFFYLKIIN
jgi:hypothetical protein